jgi:Bacterial Ig-like domain
VAPKASLRATFSEKMRASSINTKTFKLFKKKGSTKKLSARVTYNAATKKATLNPTTSLRKGLSYKAVLSPGAKDVAGKSLDQKRTTKGLQQKVWSFTVRK